MNIKTLLLASGAACALTSLATADMVDVAGTFIGPGQTFNITLNSTTEDAIAGQIGIAITNSTGVNLNGNWISYCTEITQNINVPGSPQTYQVLSVSDLPIPGLGMGSTRADAIARIYAAAAGAQYTASNDFCGAFALAIWEISNDYDGTAGSLNIGSGSFVVNSALNAGTLAAINGLFAAAADTNGAMASITGLGSESYQDLIIEVPAPGALSLLGLAGMFGARRRRA